MIQYPMTLEVFKRSLELRRDKNVKNKYPHEDLVQEILISVGFKEADKTKYPKNGIGCYDEWVHVGAPLFIPDGTFIHHYYGENCHPDFLWREGDKIFWVECKSTATISNIQCNSTLPVAGIYYIITGKHKTMLAFGERIVTEMEVGKFKPWSGEVDEVNARAPKDVDGVEGRARKFFKVNGVKRLIKNGHGDKCTQEIIDMLEGRTPIIPEKVGAFYVHDGADLVHLL